MRCDLVAAGADRSLNRAVFGAHFPDLDAARMRWNAVIERSRYAPDGLWRWFATTARERGITEPPFLVGALIDRLGTWTLERCRRWELDFPEELAVQHFSDRLGGSLYVSVYVMGERVATLPGGTHSDVSRRVEAADGLVQALLREALSSEEAREISDARDSLLVLKHDILEDIHVCETDGQFGSGRDCPRCNPPHDALPPPLTVVDNLAGGA